MSFIDNISKSVLIQLALLLCFNYSNAQVSIIPVPNQLKMGKGVYVLDASDMIVFKDNQISFLAAYLRDQVNHLTKVNLKIAQKELSVKGINLSIIPSLTENEEGYTLDITSNKIAVVGASKTGLMHGIQSFLQIVFPNSCNGDSVNLPALSIVDEPILKWRGMHLDVSRHFYSVEFVKHMLDMMAMHKLNTFHWHLTDDQGWRIEIKKYPKLTEISSVRKETMLGHYVEKNQIFDNTPYGGFYTQEQIKEVVDYATKLCITVVPEIEMPGHAVAALSAYPELSCTGGPFEVYTKWGVSDDVFCAGKEETFEFMQNVISEVLDLFPGQYIHVGGDECPKTRWKACPLCQKRMKENRLKDEMELQSYFIKRMEKFIASKGKKLIGWDEILEGGLPERAAVMSWRGCEGGIEAAKSGHDVVMTPGGYCYFDHYQGKPELEPLAFGGFTSLSKVYDFKPVPLELSKKEKKHILGAQANVWTEYITTEEKVEYMVFPRLCAMSEVLWSEESVRDYDDFMNRLSVHLKRLDNENVNYRPLNNKIKD